MIGQVADASTRRAIRGMLTLATGAGAGKLIGIASLPIITRLYSPADIGALAVFASFLMLAAPLLTLQYRQALPVPRTDGAAINLLCLCASLIFGMSSFLAAALALAADPLFRALSMDAVASWWWMLPLGTAVYALFTTCQLWATRRRRYGAIARAEVTQSAAGNGAKIALAFALPPPLGLLVGHVVAQGGGIVQLGAVTVPDIARLWRHVTLRRVRTVARQYQGFPLFRLPSQLVLILSSQAPVFFIAAFFGAATAGQFGLAMMALSMPMNLIGRTMAKAFFGEMAHLGRRAGPEIRQSVLLLTRLLGAVGLVVALLLYFAAPPLFPLLFGPQWAEAGAFAAILAILVTFQFVAAPIMNVLSVFRREDVYLQLNLQRLCLVAAVFGCAYLFELPIDVTLLAYSMLLAMHYILCFFRVLSVMPRQTATGSA